jgi:hypothetical protein
MKLCGKSRYFKDWIEAGIATVTKILRDASRVHRPKDTMNLPLIERMLVWLCRAQDEVVKGGFSAGYFPLGGWGEAYPETTGYIIPTLYDSSSVLNRADLGARAKKAVNWLLSLQLSSGAFPGGFYRQDQQARPSVFNTGQILFGLIRNYLEEGHQAIEEAIFRSASWLTSVQEGDGSWRKFCYKNHTNTYNARAAWALALSGLVLGIEKFLRSAEHQMLWVLTRRTRSGWIEDMGFKSDNPVYLHTLAYTLRGLLEISQIVGNKNGFNVSNELTCKLANEVLSKGRLSGAYKNGLEGIGTYQCLTGNAQIGMLFGRFFIITGQDQFKAALRRLNGWVRAGITISSRHPGHNGGVAGSLPFWGSYMTLRFPNWAVKFAIDALLLEDHLFGTVELPKYSESLGVLAD